MRRLILLLALALPLAGCAGEPPAVKSPVATAPDSDQAAAPGKEEGVAADDKAAGLQNVTLKLPGMNKKLKIL